MTLHIHTFEHATYGYAIRGSAHARNYLAGIVRSARNAGLVAKRRNGVWSFTMPAFGFSAPSSYLLR